MVDERGHGVFLVPCACIQCVALLTREQRNVTNDRRNLNAQAVDLKTLTFDEFKKRVWLQFTRMCGLTSWRQLNRNTIMPSPAYHQGQHLLSKDLRNYPKSLLNPGNTRGADFFRACHRAAVGLFAFCKKETIPDRTRLTSSTAASLIAREEYPASAMMFINTFELVKEIFDVEVCSKTFETAGLS